MTDMAKTVGKWNRAGCTLKTKDEKKEFGFGDSIERGKDLPAKSFDAHVKRKNIAPLSAKVEADVPGELEE